MDTKNKQGLCWRLVLWGLGTAIALAACASDGNATATLTPVPTKTALLRLENGVVEVQDEKSDWVLVGGDTTFELVGELESTDPWMVTGNTFAVRAFTHIVEGLEAGDLVRVEGLILEDGTWLANSIEPVQDQIDPSIALIGKVDSIDPWMVHGLTLEVTNDTEVSGEITPGMIVEVEILLLEDGAWEVLSLTSLSNFTEIPGCTTVTATVVSVDGNEVQFAGWPSIELDEVKIENEAGKETALSPHQTVLVVVCTTEDGQSMITKIVVLKASSANGGKVLICHKPNKKRGHTLSVAAPALPAHLAHGDRLGTCP